MKYLYGFLVLCACIFLIDLSIAHIEEYRKERKRQKNLKRFAMSPFNGTRKSTWLS